MHTNSATETPTRTASARIIVPLFEPAVAAAAQHEHAGQAQGAEDDDEGDGDQQASWRSIIGVGRASRGRHGVSATRAIAAAAPAWRRPWSCWPRWPPSRSPLRLGFWQLDRAAQKIALQARARRARARAAR